MNSIKGNDMPPVQQTIEAAVAATANKLTYAGSAGSVVGWLTASNIAMFAGILIGLAGFAVNWYYKRKNDKRAEDAHQFYMAKLNSVQLIAAPLEQQMEPVL